MASGKKITIRFSSAGDEKLISAFKQLAAAQGKFNKVTQKTKVESTKLNNATIALTAKLAAQGKTWKQVGISAKVVSQAYQGNLIAIEKLRIAMKKANVSTRILGGSFAVLRSKLLIYSFAATLVNKVFVDMVQTFSKQESVNKKLQVGLSNIQGTTEGVTQRLIDYSSALQQATSFGDELITNGMAQLTTFGLNEGAIKSLTPQVLNVARAIQTTSGSMPDLNSLFIAFGKSTSTAVSALTRYGVVLTDSEKKQLEAMGANERAGAIAKILDKQYGGLADAYAKTTAGMLEGAAAARGDAAEAFGEVLAPAVLAASKALKGLAEAITVENIKILGTSVLAMGVAFGIAQIAIGAAALGVTGFSTALIAAQLATNAFMAKLIAMTGGIYGIVVAVGLATAGLLAYFGAFSDDEPLTDAEKRTKKLADTTADLTKQLELAVVQRNNMIQAIKDEQKVYTSVPTPLIPIKSLAEAQEKLFGAVVMGRLSKRHINAATASFNELINVAHEYYDLQGNKQTVELTGGDTSQVLTTREKLIASGMRQAALAEKLKSLNADENATTKVKVGILNQLNAEVLNGANLKMQANSELSTSIILEAQLAALADGEITQAEKRNIFDIKAKELLSAKNLATLTEIEQLKLRISLKREEMGLDETKAEAEVTKTQAANIAISQVGAMSGAVSKKHSAEMAEMKAGDNYKNASRQKQQDLEKGVLAGQAKEKRRIAMADKAASLATAGMNTYTAVTKAWAQGGIFGGVMAVIAAAAGAAQIAAITSTPIPKFARGGMVGGRRHSAGGTMIEAEKGEFVMSRNAVESVGIEAMNRLNAGGGGGSVNISFAGNVMSQDFIEDEAIPMIKEAIRRGADIGVA